MADSFESRYEIKSVGVHGTYLDVIDDYTGMSLTLVVNDVGSLTLDMPPDYPLNKLVPDTRFEVWRAVGTGPLKLLGNTQFILQEIKRGRDQNGARTLQVVAPTINSILKRRVIPYNDDGSVYVERVDYSENIMKYAVYWNFMLPTDTNRMIATATFDTETATTALTSVVGAQYAHKIVADVLKDLADQSYQLGYALYYDIEATAPPGSLLFKTYRVRGQDRRSSSTSGQLLLGYDLGNIGAYTISEIYTDEITFVYCAGPGEDDVRSVITAEDTTRSGRSVFGRRELWEDYQDGDDDAKLTSRANALLAANRPQKIFEGEMINVPGTLFGVHWNWGDILPVSVEGESFDTVVSAVSIGMQSGKEDIRAVLRSVS
jgi:hypothetical protein